MDSRPNSNSSRRRRRRRGRGPTRPLAIDPLTGLPIPSLPAPTTDEEGNDLPSTSAPGPSAPGPSASGLPQQLAAPVAHSLAQRCHRQFPGAARARGRDYFLAGRVSEPSTENDVFTLSVRGSGVNYNVTLDFSQASTAKSLQGRCDCPYYEGGGLCKHLWAAILQIDKSGVSGTVPENGPLRVLHQNPRPRRDDRVRGERVRPEGSTRRTGPLKGISGPLARGHSSISTVPTNWIERLERIQGTETKASARAFAGHSTASFVINATETLIAGKIVIDLWTRDRLTNGELGALKPSRISNNDLLRFSDIRDQDILSLLIRTCDPQVFAPFGRSSGHFSSRFTVDPLLETHLLPSLSSAGKLFLSRAPNGSPDDAERPLRMDRGRAWELELQIEALNPTNFRIEGCLRRENETRSVNDPIAVFRSGFLLLADRLGRLSDSRHVSWVTTLRTPHEFLVPRDQGDTLMKRLLSDHSSPKLSWPEEMGWSRTVIDPKPKGVFRVLGNDPATGRMTLTVSFDYAGREVSLDETDDSLVDLDNKTVYLRNLEFEEATLTHAREVLHDEQGTGTLAASDLHRVAGELSAQGWSVYIENQRLRIADDFAMNVTSSTDWFDLKIEASFGDKAAGQSELMAALEAKNGLIKLADGSLGMLPKEWLARYAALGSFGEKLEGGALRFNRSQGLMLNSVLNDVDDRVRADGGFLTFRDRIRKFDGVKTSKAPAGFRGKLRNYQKEGLTWLGFLDEFEMGGILADDMGLGKTIQILAFLQARKGESGLPNLVVAPKSLVFNWIDEAAKFVPDLKVIRYSGAGRSKQFKDIAKADVVITTYGTLRTDIEKLRAIEFDVAIVDEAQAIKNKESQSAIACKQLRAKHRIALTGTPIENSIGDLYSILEFTNPGLLSLSKEKEIGQDTQTMLAKMIKPFVLRRTKEKVLKELPEKSEQVLFCEMSTEEQTLYNGLRDHYRKSLTEKIEKSGLGRSKIHVLEALLRLRQAACHPGLVDPEKRTARSAKLELLVNQIQEVIQEGHKALVFSQFTSLLALVKTSLDAQGIRYEYLDGKTEDRKTPVEHFQSDPDCPVFLISLKAGGTGLNLTAADYVFILDPWWNPAVESQAISRAHRMGQTQKVFAYRMIAKGTVEEKILELQKTKKELAESIISEDKDFLKKLTRDDLEMLLG